MSDPPPPPSSSTALNRDSASIPPPPPSPPLAPAPSSTLPSQSALQGPHALSLKVMRISAPTLHTSDRPYHEDHSFAAPTTSRAAQQALGSRWLSLHELNETRLSATHGDELLPAFSQSLTASLQDDMISNQAAGATAPSPSLSHSAAGPSTLRDWPLSSMLVLPNSFGTIYLGETFRAYLCVRNEAQHPLREPGLRVELQTGDGGESAGRASGSRVLLADIIMDAPSGGDQLDPVYELQTGGMLERTVRHEIKELGPHVLICTVSYKVPFSEAGQTRWMEKNFRKFYKFAVPASPISVRTKTHEARSASELLHPDHRVRERVMLEVQVQNVSNSPLVFEALNLRPEPEWEWESIDRPDLSSRGHAASDAEQVNVSSLWQGLNEPLLPDDVRQYLFKLVPKSDKATRRLPPLPSDSMAMAPLASSDRKSAPGSALDRRALTLPSVRSTLAPQQHAGDPHAPHEPQNLSSTPLALVETEPIGSLDISWRMSQGEPGRLQTSPLSRRRTVVPPVRCAPPVPHPHAASDGSDLASIAETATSPSKAETPLKEESTAAATATAPAPAPGLGPAFVPASLSSPSVSRAAKLPESVMPPPTVQVDLNLADAALPLTASARRAQVLKLPFRLWVRDLSVVATVSAKATKPAGSSRDSDDSDDDRPLSEIASPHRGGQPLPANVSRRSSAISVPAAVPPDAPMPKVVGGSRTLHLALQTLALSPVGYPMPAGSTSTTIATADESLAASREGDEGPLRAESPSLLRTLTSPSTPSKPNLRRSLQHNIVANLASSPLLRTGSLSSRRGNDDGPTTPQLRSASPQVPPTPPPKEGGNPFAEQPQHAGLRDAPANVYPHPYLDRTSCSGDLPDVDGEGFEHRGSSWQVLSPVTVPLEDGEEVGQATVDFDVEYLPLRSGMVRIGGLRVLVLGWQDQVVRKGENGEARTDDLDKVELLRPIALREWSVVAELFVR